MEIQHFPEKHEGEKILIVIRKHYMAYVRVVSIFLFVFILPIFLTFSALFYVEHSISRHNLFILGIFACFYVLYGLTLLLIMWLNEAFDVFILTSERLVDITQVNFFERTVTATPLTQIQDSTSSIEGFVQTIFNYGNIGVKTAAGSASMFFIDSVPRPDKVAQDILAEARKYC